MAHAERITGLVKDSFFSAAGVALVSFDSQTPGTVSVPIPIVGVTNLRAIDYRPADGRLYGYGYTAATRSGQLFTIDTATGLAAAVGGPVVLSGAGDTRFVSIDFNPVSDRLRVMTEFGGNYRVNPADGSVTVDTPLSLDGDVPFLSDIAYSNNRPGASATTLYGLDYYADTLVTVGSVNGNPTSPNSGQVTTVGGFGGPVQYGSDNGFDISAASGIGYVTFDRVGPFLENDEFFQVDLATGALTQIGDDDVLPDLLDISVNLVPEPGGLAVLCLAGLAALRRRR